MSSVPWRDIGTLFLDAGNTIVSIDFPWVASVLGERGIAVDAAALERAEAAARPRLDAWLGGRKSTETDDTFHFYLANVLERLAPIAARGDGFARELAAELTPVLRAVGHADRLWKRVMPGVPEALARFRDLGLQLVVVSNSDGSVERSLASLGLRPFFHAVMDSHVVGHEKPDRRFFEAALAAAGSRPDRTAHVGDLVYADVKGARGAGIHPVLLDPHDDWPPVDCERARDLGEIAERIAAAR
jgi:HAD superfamily hydrolase (TIGR01509 family)